MNNIKTILSCNKLSKFFIQGKQNIKILNNINANIMLNEQVAIVGVSGSGKSTLLHLLAGLDTPSTGSVSIYNKNLSELDELSLNLLRNKTLGFMYQFHHLLPEFSTLDNVAMPLIIRRMHRTQAREQALDILIRVGLINRITNIPSELSGGERQRVALARALVTKPVCVLADEPTGNLDSITANKIFTLILEISYTLGTTFVIVTHDIKLASRCNKILSLSQNGLLPYSI